MKLHVECMSIVVKSEFDGREDTVPIHVELNEVEDVEGVLKQVARNLGVRRCIEEFGVERVVKVITPEELERYETAEQIADRTLASYVHE